LPLRDINISKAIVGLYHMDIQENDRSCNRDNSIKNETELCKNKANGFSNNTIETAGIITK
jgi:hypothetical protein